MFIRQHSSVSSAEPDKCNLFSCSITRTGALLKGNWGEPSWSQLQGIDRNQTACREYWCLPGSWTVEDLPMLQRPFERVLWWAPSENFYPVLHFTSLHFTSLHYSTALSPYLMQFLFQPWIHSGIPIPLLRQRHWLNTQSLPPQSVSRWQMLILYSGVL